MRLAGTSAEAAAKVVAAYVRAYNSQDTAGVMATFVEPSPGKEMADKCGHGFSYPTSNQVFAFVSKDRRQMYVAMKDVYDPQSSSPETPLMVEFSMALVGGKLRIENITSEGMRNYSRRMSDAKADVRGDYREFSGIDDIPM